MTQPSDQPPSKKLKLSDLIRPKVAVPTSIGELFVRSARVSDWEVMDGQSPAELGKSAIQQLSNRAEDKEAREPLGEEDLLQLQESDFRILGEALAKLNGWSDLGEGDARTAVGVCVEKVIREYKERHRKMLADMQNSLKSSYAFLGKDTLAKLQSQMMGLANLRSSIADIKLAEGALAAFGGVNNANELLKAAKGFDIPGMARNSATELKLERLDSAQHLRPFDPADTKLGRATLENVRISQETSQKLDSLVELVAGLNQTVIQDVLPAWVKQVEADQASAQQAFQHASASLRWTQIAVVISIVVTLGATWWQVQVAREIDRDNSEQQKRVEQLMRQQLDTQRQQTEQYTRDAESLRAILEKLTPSNASVPKRKH